MAQGKNIMVLPRRAAQEANEQAQGQTEKNLADMSREELQEELVLSLARQRAIRLKLAKESERQSQVFMRLMALTPGLLELATEANQSFIEVCGLCGYAHPGLDC